MVIYYSNNILRLTVNLGTLLPKSPQKRCC
jgi:hypothetical protein